MTRLPGFEWEHAPAPDRLPALTLWTPWSELVAMGLKAHETRSWATSYRGPLLITAAARWDRLTKGFYRQFQRTLSDAGLAPLPDRPRLGVAVALVELTECRTTTSGPPRNELDALFGDWRAGRYAWRLTDVRPLDPAPKCRGGQRLWAAPANLAAAARAAAGKAVVA